MLFSGQIRCDASSREAFFTSDGNDREYRLIYGDETSMPDPIESGYYIVAGRDGQRVAFHGEVSDVDGDNLRIESSVRPVTDPPDIDEGKGFISSKIDSGV